MVFISCFSLSFYFLWRCSYYFWFSYILSTDWTIPYRVATDDNLLFSNFYCSISLLRISSACNSIFDFSYYGLIVWYSGWGSNLNLVVNSYYSHEKNPFVLIISMLLYELAPFKRKSTKRYNVTIHDHFAHTSYGSAQKANSLYLVWIEKQLEIVSSVFLSWLVYAVISLSSMI